MGYILEVEVLGLVGPDIEGRRKEKSRMIPSVWPQARPWCSCSYGDPKTEGREGGGGSRGFFGVLILRSLLDTEAAAWSRQLPGSLREVLSGDIKWRAIRLDEITLGAKDI